MISARKEILGTLWYKISLLRLLPIYIISSRGEKMKEWVNAVFPPPPQPRQMNANWLYLSFVCFPMKLGWVEQKQLFGKMLRAKDWRKILYNNLNFACRGGNGGFCILTYIIQPCMYTFQLITSRRVEEKRRRRRSSNVNL